MSNLRKIRETMKVSQAVLAEKVGCTTCLTECSVTSCRSFMTQKKKEPSNGKPKLHAIMASIQRC